jgi:hypothetical protein
MHLEKKLYPLVEKWMRRHFLCFRTAVNTGLRYSRIDVVGVRDVGGDLSGDVETISVEVKRGAEPFATACGQALGYKIYANRVYLADIRTDSFSHEEVGIASQLGIGLIQIKNNSCKEILTSPSYAPMNSMNLRLLEKLRLGKCQFCGSFFETGDLEHGKWRSKLSKEDLNKAIKERKGLIFWNYEVAERKDRLGIRQTDDTYERRFVCPDCVEVFISPLSNKKL